MSEPLSGWSNLHDRPGLAENELHLWRFPLTATCHTAFLNLLNYDERQRAGKLVIPVKRAQFIQSRAILRSILAKYLSTKAADILFSYNENGKPELISQPPSGLYFNLSHTGGWGLIAVSRQVPVGVDIERVAENVDIEAIAERYFAPPELDALKKTYGRRRVRTFFRIWTKKESLIKMTGGAIFASAPDLPEDGWIGHVHVAPGYVAAVASAASVETVFKFHYLHDPEIPQGI